jgi:hypothetical protein
MRAMERFEKKFIPEPNSGCWLWLGATSKNGYGVVRLSNPRRMTGAHRFSYELFVGPIPDGFTVDHQCNNIACVNPNHLKAMTQLDNGRRYTEAITHCPQGHPYDEKNTRIIKGYGVNDGYKLRVCRICFRESDRRYRERKRARNNGL